MAVHSKYYETNHDLMVTYTTEPDKYTLHKVGTDENYDDPIDLINGTYETGDRAGEPKCRFEYVEIDKPKEEVIEDGDGVTEDDNQEEA